MQLHSVEGNRQRLDGGAMFGNCPRLVWSKWYQPDEQHRIELACRALLVRESSGRNVLFEAGIGVFFEPKLRERFGVTESEHVLLRSLGELGLRPEDIDVVVLSHLHFDHAGGVLSAWNPNAPLSLVFPKASYVVGQEAWRRAKDPHARDRASFIAELQPLLEATGRLEIVPGDRSHTLGEAYQFTLSSGHTPGLMLTRVLGAPEGPITFMGDLVPGAAWVHLPITMGYDRFAELLIEEKQALLTQLEARHEWLFFTHDRDVAAARVQRDAQGKFSAVDKLPTLAWT